MKKKKGTIICFLSINNQSKEFFFENNKIEHNDINHNLVDFINFAIKNKDIMIEDWQERAIELFDQSLNAEMELNNLDWKTNISDKGNKVAAHLSAFANTKGGGFLVFGVCDDRTLIELDPKSKADIVRRIGNISSDNLNPTLSVEHAILDYEGINLLFIYIPECHSKPVSVKGGTFYDSYERSAAQTRRMSRRTVELHLANAHGYSFELQEACRVQNFVEISKLIDIDAYYKVTDRNRPYSSDTIVEHLIASNCVTIEGKYYIITNLGALLFAKNIKDFTHLSNRTVRVIEYASNNNLESLIDIRGAFGYAVSLDSLLNYIVAKLPSKEIIEGVRRINRCVYPVISIREFLANALVHQDFMIEGRDIMVEIFKDRMVITNPGTPLNDINRLIDMPHRSRNDKLAQAMYEFGMCERRGSGIDRAITEIENMFLPPVKMEKGEDYTRVTIYSPKEVHEMTIEETIRACYQHACILHEKNETLTKYKLMIRLGTNEDFIPEIENIIEKTIENRLIKPAFSETIKDSDLEYVPYYA